VDVAARGGDRGPLRRLHSRHEAGGADAALGESGVERRRRLGLGPHRLAVDDDDLPRVRGHRPVDRHAVDLQPQAPSALGEQHHRGRQERGGRQGQPRLPPGDR